LKILQFSKFYPPFHGGIESIAYELTEGLNSLGISTDVLCASTDYKTTTEISEAGYLITRIGSFGRLMSTSISPGIFLHLRKIWRNYDIIHLHMPNPMAALAVYMVRPKGKLVLHWHSDVISQKLMLKFYESLQNWVLKRSDAIIVTSEPYFLASDALKPFINKIEVIPLGIRPPSIYNQMTFEKAEIIRTQYGNRKIVFALGRMTQYKGFDTLINAANQVDDDAVILVGGNGRLLKTYKELVLKNKLENKVYLIGRVSNEEIAAYFEAATVFCLPSNARSEAFGVVLLEAMAAGKPIVSTNIPGSGVSWVNQHGVTGLNVPICDERALAESLNLLINNETLAESMGAAGRERFQREFKVVTMVDKIMALYERVLKI